jgi:hypothetical protein
MSWFLLLCLDARDVFVQLLGFLLCLFQGIAGFIFSEECDDQLLEFFLLTLRGIAVIPSLRSGQRDGRLEFLKGQTFNPAKGNQLFLPCDQIRNRGLFVVGAGGAQLRVKHGGGGIQPLKP